MTSKDVQILIGYSYWARDRLLEAVAQLSQEQFMRDLGSSFRSVRDTLAHLHAARVLWHMLQHVVNHFTYHRGQVTTMLRQSGAMPPKAMDLSAFYRERAIPAA